MKYLIVRPNGAVRTTSKLTTFLKAKAMLERVVILVWSEREDEYLVYMGECEEAIGTSMEDDEVWEAILALEEVEGKLWDEEGAAHGTEQR